MSLTLNKSPIILLLDTNVIVDILLRRNQYVEVGKIIELAIADETIECVTSTTITDIHYLVGKNTNLTSYEVQDKIRDILKILDVLPVTKEDIENALSCGWKDMEDALQYSVAKANGCDCIITNNTKDFETAEIEVMTPAEFLVKLYSE